MLYEAETNFSIQNGTENSDGNIYIGAYNELQTIESNKNKIDHPPDTLHAGTSQVGDLANEVEINAQSQSIEISKSSSFDHSIYSKLEKYSIIALGGISGFWSTISSPIYLPILPILETDLGVSEEKLNITIVIYSIFQGIAPIVFSNFSDKYGRRLLIICCFTIYIGANVGLALNNSYVGLVLLRSLQALGIASTISIASGIASDITTRSERGSYIGISTGLSLLGQAFGALIGGLIEYGLGWRAIFWFLAIASATTLSVIFLVLPETNRSIVGNGSKLPIHLRTLTVAPVLLLPAFNRRRSAHSNTIQPHMKLDPLAPFKILRKKRVILILIPSSISYSLWLMMLTTLSLSLSHSYHYNTLHVGLSYIPSGLGGLLGSITSGKVLDWYFKSRYKVYMDQKERQVAPSSRTNFNLYKARLNLAIIPTVISIVGILIFAWSIHFKVSVVFPLLGSFLVSYAAMNYLNISTTYMIDLYPSQSSCATSCVNLTRCLLAAVLIAVLTNMINTLTVGGCYSLIAGLSAVSYLCVTYILIKSEEWSRH